MTFLKRIWKATEVDRWGFKDWWTNGMGGELRFVFWGIGLVVLPLLVLGCIVFGFLTLIH